MARNRRRLCCELAALLNGLRRYNIYPSVHHTAEAIASQVMMHWDHDDVVYAAKNGLDDESRACAATIFGQYDLDDYTNMGVVEREIVRRCRDTLENKDLN